MNREDAKNYIQSRAKDYLTPDRSGKGYICPVCGSGDGKNGTGITTRDGIHFTCWAGCFSNSDIIDIIGIKDGITDYNGKLRAAARAFNITIDSGRTTAEEDFRVMIRPVKDDTQSNIHNSAHTSTQQEDAEPDFRAFFKQANQHITETDYHRGITLETLNRFNVGYVASWKHPKAPKMKASPRLIIPTSDHSYLARHASQSDYINYKGVVENKSKVGGVRLFNIAALRDAQQPIFIVEGEIDAMSIVDVGGEAIATCSTSNIHSFLQALKNAISEQAAVMPLIIAFDDDEAGQKATEELVKGLQELHKEYCIYKPHIGYKDANEALNADRKVFQSYVLHGMEHINELTAAEANREKKEYLEEITVAAHLQDFLDGVAASVNTEVISTGFPVLDSVLDGGLYEGLYGIGAISSLGKTTFALQIADQIAAAGSDVLIFSLEMSRNEMIAKSLSRLTAKITIDNHGDIRNAKTTRGIMTGKRYAGYNQTEKQLINAAVQEYAKIAGDTLNPRISIIEAMGTVGADQVKEQVEKYIKHTGKKPVVIIDYLQILAPHNEKSTDKQNTDYAILNLKRLSRDHKIPVIVISSFNRENYSVKVAMQAFKESGAIEYSTDVLIGLQLKGTGESNFDVDEAKAKHPREIEAVILKNRNGVTGKKISYNYYTMFNYFSEGEIVEPEQISKPQQTKRR